MPLIPPEDTATAPAAAAAGNWEARQKHAAFFQAQLNAVQQAAIAFFTWASVIVTLGIAMMHLSDMTPGQDWFAIFAGVIGWLVVVVMVSANFRPAAQRINATYLEEHGTLFAPAEPYRLESFLLQRPSPGPRSLAGLPAIDSIPPDARSNPQERPAA